MSKEKMSKEKINTIGCTLLAICFLLFCILCFVSLWVMINSGMKMVEIKGSVVDEHGNPVTNVMIVLTNDKSAIVNSRFVQGDCTVLIMQYFNNSENIDGKFNTGYFDYTSADTYQLYVVADGYDIYKKTLNLLGVESVDLHTITLHQ